MIRSRSLLYFGTAYLVFALAMTAAGRFPEFADVIPTWLFQAFYPNDKTNLAPYRVAHFVVIVFLVTRFVPRNWRGLKLTVLQPVIACGQQSLKVFCMGLLLSFAAHFALEMGSGSVWAQMLVSAIGLSLMSAVAYLASWSKRIEKSQIVPEPQRKLVTTRGPEGPSLHPRGRDHPASDRWFDSIQRPSSEVRVSVQSHA